LSGIYATPLIALLPLIIMLFGLGAISKIIMTVLAAVFPILINTMVGIANTDHRLITMARAFGAKDNQIFRKVSLPGSLPYIVAGMRVALGRALVYIVVAEQYGAAMGLGYLSSVAAQRFQMAAMFVPIVIIAGLLVAQITLGILTVLMKKPADIASLHVAVGALTLMTTFVLFVRAYVVAQPPSAVLSQETQNDFDEKAVGVPA